MYIQYPKNNSAPSAYIVLRVGWELEKVVVVVATSTVVVVVVVHFVVQINMSQNWCGGNDDAAALYAAPQFAAPDRSICVRSFVRWKCAIRNIAERV